MEVIENVNNDPEIITNDTDTENNKENRVIPQRHEEYQYLDAIRHIFNSGKTKADRTGVGIKSVFGGCTRWSLAYNTLPLLTTKKVFVKAVIEELLWFIKGSTNAKELSAKGVRIWDGNSSREFLDKHGFTEREEGDLGPIYGFQWRHSGAEYKDMHTNYEGQGVDQLKQCIHKIKHTPNDRRIIMSAWNPSDLSKMALPPCHCFVQFYVSDGELSCCLYQRSADMGLGVPFNLASYAMLTHMIAYVTGLKAGEFIHMTGDTHIYLNHMQGLEEQLTREPKQFPKLAFRRSKQELTDIEDFTYADFEIQGYQPHPTIKMDMAV